MSVLSASRSMPFEVYAALPAINFTTLKKMNLSPLHYQHALKHPSPDTPGKLKGRGTHTAVLEPKRFLLDYALFKPEPGKEKAIRRGKRWDEFKAMHAEDNILKADEYQHCLDVAEAVYANKDAAALLEGSKREQVIEWVDKTTGLKCKARLDILTSGAVVDLKGVKCADLRPLASEVARMLYHCQIAWYVEGCKHALGETLAGKLICVEHWAPHDVAVVDLGEDGLYAGWEMVRGWLDRVRDCMELGVWPGRYPQTMPLQLPEWVFPEDDRIMSVETEDDNDAEENANA